LKIQGNDRNLPFQLLAGEYNCCSFCDETSAVTDCCPILAGVLVTGDLSFFAQFNRFRFFRLFCFGRGLKHVTVSDIIAFVILIHLIYNVTQSYSPYTVCYHTTPVWHLFVRTIGSMFFRNHREIKSFEHFLICMVVSE
jgi:hypothetical protein